MDLLDQISTGNHGEATRIHPTQSIEEQLSDFFQTIAIPLLKDISIDFGGRVKDIFPQEIPPLFNGSEIIVTGKYYGDNPMSITVITESVQGQEIFIGKFDITDLSLMHPFVLKLWAIQKINYLLDQILLEGETSALIEQIVQLSIEFGLVTPYTSILIDPEALQGEISQEEVLGEGSEAAKMVTTTAVTAITPYTPPPITTTPLPFVEEARAPGSDSLFLTSSTTAVIPEVIGIFLVLGLFSLIIIVWRRKRKK